MLILICFGDGFLWWSDNCLVRIPDFCVIVGLVNLQNRLYISKYCRQCDMGGGVKAIGY